MNIDVFRNILKYFFKDEDTKLIIFHNNVRKITSEDEKLKILAEYHCTPVGGHQGINRTAKKIRAKFKWSKMHKDIKSFIRSCESCQKNKYSRNTKMPLVITTTAKRPFEKVFLDIVGPLPITDSHNKYILTFEDDLTKFCEAIAIPNQEASTIAESFVTHIICKFGTPSYVLTDQGANFLSAIFKETCKLLKISKIQTTAYHPQSNGSLERTHRNLAEYLRNFVSKDNLNWDKWIAYAMFTYNISTHTSTNFTPFELLFVERPKFLAPSAIRQKYVIIMMTIITS